MARRLPLPDALSRIDARYWAMIAFLALVALAGGASRPDSLAQPFVRVVALGYVALVVLMGWVEGRRVRRMGIVYAIIVASALVLALHLVPLPPGTWTGLAGRDFYAQAATVAGVEQPWRPLTLSPDRTWNALYSLSVPFAAAIGLATLDRQAQARLIWPVFLIIFLSAVLGLAQISGGEASPLRWYAVTNKTSAVGLFANRNHAALFLACFFPLLALIAMRRVQAKSAVQVRLWLSAAVTLFMLMMVVLTGSRAGLMLTVLAILVAIVLIAPSVRQHLKSMRRKRKRLYLVGAALLIVVALAGVVSLQQAVAVQRLRDFGLVDATRLTVWPISWDMTREFFPYGIGFGAFDPIYRRFEPFDTLSTSYINAVHNDYLQILLEGGVLGAILLAFALAWWAVQTLRIWRTSRDVTYANLSRVGSAIVLLVILASAVDYPARTPLIMTLLVIAACWMQLSDHGRGALRKPAR